MNTKHQIRKISSLLGRESSRMSATSYECERGVNKEKIKKADRATECAMTDISKNDKNTIKQKQPSCLAASSPAASSDTNHSPLTIHYSLKRKLAFTLAETLITLGIIGIVAALTLPTLIANYQKQATANKVKKFYTNFSQAIRQAEVDNGEFKNWNAETPDELYDNYLAQYLKVVQVQRYIHMWGNFTNGIKFIFADGTQAICATYTNLEGYGNGKQIFPCIFYTRGTGRWFSSATDPSYKYNGPREIFWFLINQNGQLVPPHMWAPRDSNINSCKTENDKGNGFTDCGTLLYKDGWEIKDDYPW